ncbi:hypothetical protein GEV33_004314 [Tenebrio molitor]|uniref:Uncharacterized protein n=1 Tax=Tenebrio molitor TaxID=7067 RepID=A0A8J6HNE4_TENMO|nr:hypothetical protein GEV33_004314 [Tenebrio molitor]
MKSKNCLIKNLPEWFPRLASGPRGASQPFEGVDLFVPLNHRQWRLCCIETIPETCFRDLRPPMMEPGGGESGKAE